MILKLIFAFKVKKSEHRLFLKSTDDSTCVRDSTESSEKIIDVDLLSRNDAPRWRNDALIFIIMVAYLVDNTF